MKIFLIVFAIFFTCPQSLLASSSCRFVFQNHILELIERQEFVEAVIYLKEHQPKFFVNSKLQGLRSEADKDTKVFAFLLEHLDSKKRTSAEYRAINKLVETFLERGVRFDPDKSSVAMTIMRDANIQVVRKLRQRLSKVQRFRYGDESSLLHWAASNRNIEVTEYLLENKVNPNSRDIWGATPLHQAAAYGVSRTIQLLVDYGARPSMRDNSGDTPLHYAVIQQNLPNVRELIFSRASTGTKNEKGESPGDLALSLAMGQKGTKLDEKAYTNYLSGKLKETRKGPVKLSTADHVAVMILFPQRYRASQWSNINMQNR